MKLNVLAAGLIAASLAAPIAAPVVASAQSLSTVIGDFAACKDVKKKKSRLKCFEAALARHEPLAAAGDAPAAVASLAEPSASTPEDAKEEFGLSDFQREQRQLSSVDKNERKAVLEEQRRNATITDRVLHLVKRGDGRRLIVLESGQVWMDTNDPALSELAAGQEIEITKSRFGGFRLKRPGRVGQLGVRRIE